MSTRIFTNKIHKNVSLTTIFDKGAETQHSSSANWWDNYISYQKFSFSIEWIIIIAVKYCLTMRVRLFTKCIAIAPAHWYEQAKSKKGVNKQLLSDIEQTSNILNWPVKCV